jgi:hypothetical protein
MYRRVLVAGLIGQLLPSSGHADTLQASASGQVRRWQQGDGENWRLEYVYTRSARIAELDKSMRSRSQQLSGSVMQAVGRNLSIGLSASAARISRGNRLSAVLPTKSHSLSLDVGGYVEVAGGPALRAGWFRSGGWGARDLQHDIIRMNNGDEAARSGAELALELPMARMAPRFLKSARWALAATDGKSAAPGQPWRHDNTLALRFTATF